MYAARRSTYDIEDGAVRVAGELVLGGVTNETLIVGEGDPGRCDTVTCKGHLSATAQMQRSSGKLTLVVDHDLNLAVLHNTNTRVGCSKIDTNDGSGDSIAVLVGDGLLVFSASCLRQHQAGDEDHEEVEGNAPCGALAGAP